MGNYKWVESVSVKQLSNRALVLVSRFARILKQVNGKVLSMQDPQLTQKMVAEVNSTNDPRLRSIFEELLLDFHGSAERSTRGPQVQSSVSSDQKRDDHQGFTARH